MEENICDGIRAGFCLQQLRELKLSQALVSTGFVRSLAALRPLEKLQLTVSRVRPADLLFCLRALTELSFVDLYLSHEQLGNFCVWLFFDLLLILHCCCRTRV